MAKAERRGERDETLRAGWQALDAGDVVAARRLGNAVLASRPPVEVAADARDLVERTDVAWPVLGYGVFAAALLLTLVLLAVLR
ncbi:MAG TPA: hypothetical protein VEJ89_09585 [Myxococcaceae bacterium]|nr:hypothetical protein [Myxococcaceae bacterium]